MDHAEFKDKDHIVNLLTQAFADNKSVRTVCEKESSIPCLMEYCFINSYFDNLAFVNEDKTAVALCKIHGEGKFDPKKITALLKLVKELGLKKSLEIMRREKLINSQRLDKKYLHFLFLAVTPEKQGQKFGSKLIEEIKMYSQELNLPIYLETSNPKNLTLYENHGFTKFRTISEGEHDLYFFRGEF